MVRISLFVNFVELDIGRKGKKYFEENVGYIVFENILYIIILTVARKCVNNKGVACFCFCFD